MILRFLIIAAYSWSFSLFCQIDLVYHQFTSKDGLPSSEIYESYQDEKGFMWFCSDAGVCRYDGFEFELFTTENGLTDNVIIKMYKDTFGKLWFIGSNGTFSYYDGIRIQPYKYNELLINSTLNKYLLNRISVDSNETHYFGNPYYRTISISKDGIIKKYDFGNEDVEMIYDCNKEESSLFFSKKFMKFNGPHLLAIIGKNNDTTLVTIDNLISANSMAVRLKDSTVSINVGNSLILYKNGKVVKKTFKSTIIYQYVDDNELWVGFYDIGVARINTEKQTYTVEERYFKNNSISSISKDGSGSFWFTSIDNGVFYCINSDAYRLDSGDEPRKVSTMASNKELLYTGGVSGELEIWDVLQKKNRLSKRYKKNIVGIAVEPNGSYYFSESVLHRIDSTGLEFNARNLRGHSFKLSIGPNKNLLIWNSSVLYFSKDLVNFKKVRIARSFDNLLDDKGAIFSGDLNGILRIDQDGNEKRIYEGTRINSICFSKYGMLGASQGEGLVFINKNGNSRLLRKKEGLVSDYLNQVVVENDSTAWIASNSGVSKLLINSEGKLKISSYFFNNGLLSNEINQLLILKNNLITNSPEGITIIQKDELDRVFETTLDIEHFWVNNQDIPFKPRITLSHEENNIEIKLESVCLNCLGTRNIQYYINGEKFKTNSNVISFASLQSGVYKVTFQLMDVHWNKALNTTTIEFEILEPFWNKTWFTLISFFVFFLVIVFFTRFFLNRNKKIQNERESLIQFQQKALLLQMKPHFISNSLNSIQSHVLKEDKFETHRFISKFGALIRKNLELSNSEFISLKEEIELLNQYLDLEIRRLNKKVDRFFEISPEIDQKATKIPPFILQPIIENAIWHGINSPEIEYGEISISMLIDGQDLIISIKDNGVGINQSNTIKTTDKISMSSDILAKRLKLLESKYNFKAHYSIIDLKQSGGRGTIVKLNLPIIHE